MSEHGGSTKLYWIIWASLIVLTFVTAGVAYLDLGPFNTVAALGIATTKAVLVALFFMHLNHERRMIYWVLALTAVFFAVLMMVPIATNLDRIVQRY